MKVNWKYAGPANIGRATHARDTGLTPSTVERFGYFPLCGEHAAPASRLMVERFFAG